MAKELDRFDTKAKRNVPILVKLLGIIAGVLILTAVVALTISLTVFSKGFDDFVQSEVEHNNTGALRILEDWDWTLKGYSQISAHSSDVKQGLSEGNYSIIKDYVKFIEESLDCEMFAITDAKGAVVPNGGMGLKPGENLSFAYSVQEALKGNSTTSYEQIGGSAMALVHAAPVKVDGRVIGTAVAVYDLTTPDLVNVMQSGYNVDCTIFSGDTRVMTSLKGMLNTKLDNKAIIDLVLKQGKFYYGRNRINGLDYFTTYAPLANDNGEVKGMIFIAKPFSVVGEISKRTLLWTSGVLLVVFVILIILCYRFINWLMWRIYNVTNFLKEMETGEADLTKRCKLFIRDEMGDLIIAFDLFLDKMQKMIQELKTSKNDLATAGTSMSTSAQETSSAITEILANIDGISSQVNNQVNSVTQTADAVDEISKRITGLDDMIENQSAGVSEASTAVEEMIGNISAVNTSVDKMAASFSSLSANAQTGFNKQQDVNDRIRQIESQSEMLVEANQAISSIAEQTNLLAMNAAIEAAHAGEAGKGFSVVADEIRKLSETSSQQSKTIGEQLNNIKDSITEVVSASNESSNAFAAVSSKIKETDELVAQIKAAMEEQNSGSKQIGMALRGMNDSTVDVRKASKEMQAKNERIMSEVRMLKDSSTVIKQSMTEMSAGANRINETGASLSNISNQMKDSIEKIGGQIDLFTV